MNRHRGLLIILLCGVISACTSTGTAAPDSQAQLLATLTGSLRMVEAEAWRQLEADARTEAHRDLIGVFNRAVDDLRRAGWPESLAEIEPCPGYSTHCPDSKCASIVLSDAICLPPAGPSTMPVQGQMGSGLAAAMKVLDLEVMLRFAHSPKRGMTEHLDRRLLQAYNELRARVTR